MGGMGGGMMKRVMKGERWNGVMMVDEIDKLSRDRDGEGRWGMVEVVEGEEKKRLEEN